MPPELAIKTGAADSPRLPSTYQELPYHPVTKKPGRYAVRTGSPVQVWDKAERRLKWVRHQEVERLPDQPDDSFLFIVANAGYGNQRDLEELSEEAAERRRVNRRNRPPLMGPPDWMIKEACHQLQVQGGRSWTVGDNTFRRKSIEISVPRDASWAQAMADEAKRGW